jgi:predicted AAA+ superfamily ATPase
MSWLIERSRHQEELQGLLDRHPVVGILGARQVGKTTLAQQLAARYDGPVTFFDLEDPTDLARRAEPMLALRDLRGLIIVDEVQRRPDLFTVLRVLADRPERPARFLVLGSASPELLRQTTESLAGRIFYYELDGSSVRSNRPRSMSRTAACCTRCSTWRPAKTWRVIPRSAPRGRGSSCAR